MVIVYELHYRFVVSSCENVTKRLHPSGNLLPFVEALHFDLDLTYVRENFSKMPNGPIFHWISIYLIKRP